MNRSTTTGTHLEIRMISLLLGCDLEMAKKCHQNTIQEMGPKPDE